MVFSNNPGFADNRAYNLAAVCSAGRLNIAAAYPQFNGSGSATETASAMDPAESPSNGIGGFQPGSDVQRTIAAAANYTYGPTVIGFAYSHSQYQNTRSFESNNGTLLFDNFELNGRCTVTEVFKLGAANGRQVAGAFHRITPVISMPFFTRKNRLFFDFHERYFLVVLEGRDSGCRHAQISCVVK